MKRARRFAFAAAAVLLAAAPPQSGASIFTPVATTIREALYSGNGGTVKVPVSAPCPSYGEWFSLAEKQNVSLMAQLAQGSYLEIGVAYFPGKYVRLVGEDGVIQGEDRAGGARVQDFLGAGAEYFKIRPDGTVTVPGGSGFQAELYYNPETGGLTVAFRGSEKKELADWGTDILQAAGSETTQYEAAARLLASVLDAFPGHVDVTGHSLGGGLAQYAMAANDLHGRVDGYTFNSAGLSRETLGRLSQAGIDEAGAHLSNVRVAGDTVSFFESHIGNIFDVPKADGTGNAHYIQTMIDSLDKVPMTDGPGRAAAPLCGTGDYADPDPFAIVSEWLGEGLSAFLPADVSGPIAEALGRYARDLAISKLLEQAGAADSKILELASKAAADVAAAKQALYAKLPDDNARAAMDALLSDIASGDSAQIAGSAKAAAYAIADPYIDDALSKAGIGEKDRAKIVDATHEAFETWVSGGDVGENVSGNVESFVFDKLRRELGDGAAEAWKAAWTLLRSGEDAWEQFGKAAFDSFEVVAMRELQQALDRAFASVEKHCPWLSDFFGMAGIDSASVFALVQDVWGVVKGDGTMGEKLERISDIVATQLWTWYSNFVSALTDKAVRAALALVDWLAGAIGKLIAKLDELAGELLDGGTHAKFHSMLEYCDALEAESGDDGVLVVDYGAGETVELGPASGSGVSAMEVVHEERF